MPHATICVFTLLMFAFGVDIKKTQAKPTKLIQKSGCMLLPTLKTCIKYFADLKNIKAYLLNKIIKNMLFQAFISCYSLLHRGTVFKRY